MMRAHTAKFSTVHWRFWLLQKITFFFYIWNIENQKFPLFHLDNLENPRKTRKFSWVTNGNNHGWITNKGKPLHTFFVFSSSWKFHKGFTAAAIFLLSFLKTAISVVESSWMQKGLANGNVVVFEALFPSKRNLFWPRNVHKFCESRSISWLTDGELQQCFPFVGLSRRNAAARFLCV